MKEIEIEKQYIGENNWTESSLEEAIESMNGVYIDRSESTKKDLLAGKTVWNVWYKFRMKKYKKVVNQ